MKFQFFLIFILALTPCLDFSQNKKKEINDFSVSLHEETINKVLTAIGEIKGSNDYEFMLISGKYHWTVKNPKIDIRHDSSDFICDAYVKVSLFEYKSKVIGNVKITYDNEKNLIYIKISKAVFEIYTMFLGKKIHIKDIHLEDNFKEPFAFEGPRTFAKDLEFMMPDSTIKKIYLVPTECKMELKWKEICTACEISACEVSIPPAIKLAPPIEATKPSTLLVTQPQKK